jgi:hypothetical protein
MDQSEKDYITYRAYVDLCRTPDRVRRRAGRRNLAGAAGRDGKELFERRRIRTEPSKAIEPDTVKDPVFSSAFRSRW